MSALPNRCDIGSDFNWSDKSLAEAYGPPCEQPPTHRYRSTDFGRDHWLGQCAAHVGLLDRRICTVEPLAVTR